MLELEKLKEILNLRPLPNEGGFYAETHRSGLRIPGGVFSQYSETRAAGTAIYYLLTPDTFSALHRLPGDEIFHFYLGDAVEMLQLAPNGGATRIVLGTDISSGMRPQVIVPGGTWQGSRLVSGGRYALMGTTMAPGFEFADYEAGCRQKLMHEYREYADTIKSLTVD